MSNVPPTTSVTTQPTAPAAPTPQPPTQSTGLRKYWLLAIGIIIYLATVALLIWRPNNPWQHPPGLGDYFACFLGAALNPLLAFVFIVHLMLRPDPTDEPPSNPPTT